MDQHDLDLADSKIDKCFSVVEFNLNNHTPQFASNVRTAPFRHTANLSPVHLLTPRRPPFPHSLQWSTTSGRSSGAASTGSPT